MPSPANMESRFGMILKMTTAGRSEDGTGFNCAIRISNVHRRRRVKQWHRRSRTTRTVFYRLGERKFQKETIRQKDENRVEQIRERSRPKRPPVTCIPLLPCTPEALQTGFRVSVGYAAF